MYIWIVLDIIRFVDFSFLLWIDELCLPLVKTAGCPVALGAGAFYVTEIMIS